MVVKVIRELLRRNPQVKPEMIEENAWGVFCQEKDQGLTLGPDIRNIGRSYRTHVRAIPSTGCVPAA